MIKRIMGGKYTPEELQEKLMPYIQYLSSMSQEEITLQEAYKYIYAEYVSSMQEQLGFLELAKKTLEKINNEKTSN